LSVGPICNLRPATFDLRLPRFVDSTMPGLIVFACASILKDAAKLGRELKFK
jgi:hypothetical protein